MSEMTLERACEILNDHRHAGQTDWEPNGGEAVSVGRGWAGYRIRWGAARAIETAMRLEREAPTLRDEAAAVLAQLDELAAIWGDEGVFRRCRDRLRAALAKGGGA